MNTLHEAQSPDELIRADVTLSDLLLYSVRSQAAQLNSTRDRRSGIIKIEPPISFGAEVSIENETVDLNRTKLSEINTQKQTATLIGVLASSQRFTAEISYGRQDEEEYNPRQSVLVVIQ